MSGKRCSLLIVDDEPYILPVLAQLLSSEYDVATANSADSAQAILEQKDIDILLTDQRMPRRTGIQLLEWVRQHRPRIIRILMTGFAELEDAIAAINQGHVYHYLMKPCRTEELLSVLRNAADKLCLERDREELIEQLRLLNAELERRVEERTRELRQALHLLEQHAHKLETLALTDSLTGLLNRRAIDDVARKELQRLSRYPSHLALGIIDVDHFKHINSQYLIPGGDEVLVGLSRILTNTVRTVDAVGRIGGEEFLVVAPETTAEGAEALGQRIRQTVARTPICYHDQAIHITVSIGFSVSVPGESVEYEQLKHVAAQALQEAKETGRNRVIVRPMKPLTPQPAQPQPIG